MNSSFVKAYTIMPITMEQVRNGEVIQQPLVTGERLESTPNNMRIPETYNCRYCDRRFKGKSTMHKHQLKCKMNKELKSKPKLIHDNGNFRCSKCDLSFMSKTSGYRHTKVCIVDLSIDRKNINANLVEEMSMSTKSAKPMTVSGTDNESYCCNGCQKRFQCRQSLYKHEKYCGISYSFAQGKEMVEEEDFMCTDCEKTFESALLLHKHSKICEIKSFICNICGDAFDNNGTLAAHEASHSSSGDKPRELHFNEIVREGEKFLCKKYNSFSESMKNQVS